MSDSNINGANNQNDENDNVAVRILITGPVMFTYSFCDKESCV